MVAFSRLCTPMYVCYPSILTFPYILYAVPSAIHLWTNVRNIFQRMTFRIHPTLAMHFAKQYLLPYIDGPTLGPSPRQ
ncbi:hypothetical protein JTE90_013593 [Oedothorax gibbosus]|uniref:Uncharacterized protein n=1 Tax=Oedothorax gibbosus TaxID=931172 RepID=A0AAV6VGD8_9ARAC|nr:hypothetical protein JTE90_013593 [Oedothorax gibbosus]